MLRTRNHYCSNCLSTQRFLDLGESLVCERCTKQLERSVGAFGVHDQEPIAAVQCPPSLPRPRAPGRPLPRRESA